MNNGKVKQILLNILLILLAFTVQNCVFPLLPFLAATPLLLLMLPLFPLVLSTDGMQACFMVFCQVCCWIFSTAGLSVLYTDPPSISAISTVFFTILLRRHGNCAASDLKRCKRSLVQSVYLYISIPDPRASKSALLFYQDHAAGDRIYSCDHPVSIPSVPFSQQTAGRYWKKERYHHCLMVLEVTEIS